MGRPGVRSMAAACCLASLAAWLGARPRHVRAAEDGPRCTTAWHSGCVTERTRPRGPVRGKPAFAADEDCAAAMLPSCESEARSIVEAIGSAGNQAEVDKIVHERGSPLGEVLGNLIAGGMVLGVDPDSRMAALQDALLRGSGAIKAAKEKAAERFREEAKTGDADQGQTSIPPDGNPARQQSDALRRREVDLPAPGAGSEPGDAPGADSAWVDLARDYLARLGQAQGQRP